jgi:formylmethanofuran dehydrogenase subunit E
MPSPEPAVRQPPDSAAKSDAPEKLCFACGKNVSGHRRTKDSRGYLCLDCAKAEIAAKKEGTIPCAQCRRRVKPAGLVLHRGEMICKLCFQAHKDAEKKIIKAVPDQHYKEHEKQKLLIYGAIFVILLVIAVWNSLR